MAAGKSVTAQILADRLRVPGYDSDEAVVERAGAPITEIFQSGGEAEFRRLEADAVAGIAASPGGVVATGGGVVLDSANVAAMRTSGTVVLLDTPIEDIVSRVGDGSRPLVDRSGRQSVSVILEERREAYEAAAHFTIDTSGMNPSQVADEVERLCGS